MLSTVPARVLSPSGRGEIERWLQAHGTPQQAALRGRIVLASARGMNACAVARELGTNRKMVTLGQDRFVAGGIDSLWEVAPGRGRKPTYGPAKVAAIVEATLHGKPERMTQWSCRTMARSQGGAASRRSTSSGTATG